MDEIMYAKKQCIPVNYAKYNRVIQKEILDELSKEMVRLFNYFQDFFKDFMDETEFCELWNDIRDGVYEYQD